MDVNYIVKRIIQIIGEKKWLGLCDDFYFTCYEVLFDQIGYPICNVLPKNTPQKDMNIGDVIILDEVNNYSRVYQRVPNGKRFLIIEQYLDTTNYDSEDVWLNNLPTIKNTIFKPYKHHCTNHILTIPQLKEAESSQLWPELNKFLNSHSDKLYNYIISHLPSEKRMIIDSYSIMPHDLWNAHMSEFCKRYIEYQNEMFNV